MTISRRSDEPRFDSRYALSLSLATAAAAGGGLSFYEWLNASAADAEFWAICAGASGLVSAAMTIDATKRWRWMRRILPANLTIKNLTRLPKWPAFLALPAPSKRTAEKRTEVKREAPKNPGTPQTPGQIERERRRKAREAEVNHNFGEREAGAGAAARNPSLGPGVATGFVGNLDAVATYLRSLVPSVKYDLTRILDRDADSATRISGAVSLGVKAAAAVVIGYFIWLEALQVRASAYKAWADACIARQQAEINYSTLSELLGGAGNNLNADCKHQ